MPRVLKRGGEELTWKELVVCVCVCVCVVQPSQCKGPGAGMQQAR